MHDLVRGCSERKDEDWITHFALFLFCDGSYRSWPRRVIAEACYSPKAPRFHNHSTVNTLECMLDRTTSGRMTDFMDLKTQRRLEEISTVENRSGTLSISDKISI
jgi:hypothetical protein